MTHCTQCGAELPAGAAFCARCGRPVQAANAAQATMAGSQAIETVKARVHTSIPDFVRQQIHPSEQIFGAWSASLFDHRREGEFRHDKFVITDQRIILYHTGIIHKGMSEMPYKSITQATLDRGLIHGKVVIEAANAALTIDGISNNDASFVEMIVAGSIAGRLYHVTD